MKLTPTQQILVALADLSFPLPPKRHSHSVGQVAEHSTDDELMRSPYPSEEFVPIVKIDEAHGAYGVFAKGDPLSEGAFDAFLSSGPGRAGFSTKSRFWNSKSAETHKKLKSKRRAEKLARRKNRA